MGSGGLPLTGDGNCECDEANDSQGGTDYVGILPPVPETLPFRITVICALRLCLIDREEFCAGRAELLIFHPVSVRRLGDEPENGVHSDDCDEGCEYPPERRAAVAHNQEKNQCGEGGQGLSNPAERKAWIVDSLYGEIRAFIETPLTWKFKGMRQRHTHSDRHEEYGKHLECQQHHRTALMG